MVVAGLLGEVRRVRRKKGLGLIGQIHHKFNSLYRRRRRGRRQYGIRDQSGRDSLSGRCRHSEIQLKDQGLSDDVWTQPEAFRPVDDLFFTVVGNHIIGAGGPLLENVAFAVAVLCNAGKQM